MKVSYGKSMLEGAPFGNKNAAGKHGGSVIIVKHDTSGGSGHSAIFTRGGGLEKTYRKPTPSSLKRLGSVLNKSVKLGLTHKSTGRQYGGRTAKTATQYTAKRTPSELRAQVGV
jgi:hypothetical protein